MLVAKNFPHCFYSVPPHASKKKQWILNKRRKPNLLTWPTACFQLLFFFWTAETFINIFVESDLIVSPPPQPSTCENNKKLFSWLVIDLLM